MLFKCHNILAGIFLFLVTIIGLTAWKPVSDTDPSELIRSAEDCLSSCFNPETPGVKLKKWELKITENGFFRLRKYLPNGKQEYFSFNLNRLADMGYLGTNAGGTLTLKTFGEDIIVQTYNDPKGNIDSMSSAIQLPLKNIEAEQLNGLYASFFNLKKSTAKGY